MASEDQGQPPGGVSAARLRQVDESGEKRPGKPAFTGGVSAQAARAPSGKPSDLQPASGAAAQYPYFGYQGGPIITWPEVHASFWGASWTQAAHMHERENLIQFIKDFLASDYMNILSQYGVGRGAGDCGEWMGDSNLTTVKGRMTDAEIHSSIESLIDAGVLPEPGSPSNVALMIFLDESIEIDDSSLEIVMCEPEGDTAFGYHYYFTTKHGHKVYYSVIPALDDKCLKESCLEDSECSLHLAATQEQRRTQVSSHEFSEMVTDPEISAWRDRETGAENGDICNGLNATITVSGRTWTVQQMYSRTADGKGEQACIVNPPNPIPPLKPLWQSLGGVLTSRAAVEPNADGRLEVFARGSDNGLYHKWQVSAGGDWSGWARLGGIMTSNPVVAANADGRLEAFARGADNGLYHIWQASPGGSWSGWAALGGVIVSDPAVAENADGRLEVFARGTDNGLYHISQISPGASWSSGASLGGALTSDAAVARNADGRLEVFARGTDNSLQHIWQVTPGGGWSGWAGLGGAITSNPAVAANGDGRLEVFVRGSDHGQYHIWQVAAGGAWSAWQGLGGVLTSDVAVAANSDGRLETFVRGTDNGLYHMWQISPGGGWSGWAALRGVLTTKPAAARNADGRLEVFGRGTDNGLYHLWQVSAGGAWE